MLARGEVDMVVSDWLPGSHGIYVNLIEHDLLKLGVLYEPYALWGVSDFVPSDQVSQVADLTRKEVADRMEKRIQGIGRGAGISRFSKEIIDFYNLGDSGYHFRHGTLAECTGAFELAYEEKRWMVVPLWHPQYLHHRYAIRELVEPVGLLRGRDAATLVMRRNSADLVPATTLWKLRHLYLGNATVAELDYQTPADIKGNKMRIGGLGGKVWSAMGGIPQIIPAGETYGAIEKGTIDAAEFVGSCDNEKVGLFRVAKYYYYPGWFDVSPQLSFYVNQKALDALPAGYRHAIKAATMESHVWLQAKTTPRIPNHSSVWLPKVHCCALFPVRT